MAEAKSATRKQKSYFTKNTVNRYVLDDGESFIEHKRLDEGLFQQYQDITSNIKVGRDGSTEVDVALGKQRRFLLETLVTGWNLVDDEDNGIQFSPKELAELPPEIIQDLITDIYKKNPILGGDEEDDPKTT